MVHKANGRRVAISLACWLLSSVGVMLSLTMISGSSIAALVTNPAEAIKSATFYYGIATAFAWTALAVMNVAWWRGQTTSLFWPVAGGLTGLVCTFKFLPLIFLFLPCALLGGYLCVAHLDDDVPNKHEPHGGGAA